MLFHVATQIEKDCYTLIEQSAHLVLFVIDIYLHHTAIQVANNQPSYSC